MIYEREGMMALLLGVFLDLLIGDPHCFYHPIRLVGNLISVTEKGLRAIFPKTGQGEKTAGVFLSVIVCSVTAGAVAAVLYLPENPSVSASGCDGIVLLLDAGGKISER